LKVELRQNQLAPEVWTDPTKLPGVSQPARKVRWSRRQEHNSKYLRSAPWPPRTSALAFTRNLEVLGQ